MVAIPPKKPAAKKTAKKASKPAAKKGKDITVRARKKAPAEKGKFGYRKGSGYDVLAVIGAEKERTLKEYVVAGVKALKKPAGTVEHSIRVVVNASQRSNGGKSGNKYMIQRGGKKVVNYGRCLVVAGPVHA